MEFTLGHHSILTPEETDFCTECSHEGADTVSQLDTGLLSQQGSDWKYFLWSWDSSNPWVRKIPWRRGWLLTPISLPWEFHGQRSMAGYSPLGHRESNTNERLTLSLFKKEYFHCITSSVCPEHISQCIFHNVSDQALHLHWNTEGITRIHLHPLPQQCTASHPSAKVGPGSPRPILVTHSLYQSDWQR